MVSQRDVTPRPDRIAGFRKTVTFRDRDDIKRKPMCRNVASAAAVRDASF
jgi:hypothetical protein